jgi:hypothetical protein
LYIDHRIGLTVVRIIVLLATAGLACVLVRMGHDLFEVSAALSAIGLAASAVSHYVAPDRRSTAGASASCHAGGDIR